MQPLFGRVRQNRHAHRERQRPRRRQSELRLVHLTRVGCQQRKSIHDLAGAVRFGNGDGDCDRHGQPRGKRVLVGFDYGDGCRPASLGRSPDLRSVDPVAQRGVSPDLPGGRQSCALQHDDQCGRLVHGHNRHAWTGDSADGRELRRLQRGKRRALVHGDGRKCQCVLSLAE